MELHPFGLFKMEIFDAITTINKAQLLHFSHFMRHVISQYLQRYFCVMETGQ